MSCPSQSWLRCSHLPLKRHHSVSGSGRPSRYMSCSVISDMAFLQWSTPQNNPGCFAAGCFSQFSEALSWWTGVPGYTNAGPSYGWDHLLWTKKVDSLKFYPFKWLLTYPGRLFQESSLNTRLQSYVYKAIYYVYKEALEAEIFERCRCCVNPGGAIGTLLSWGKKWQGEGLLRTSGNPGKPWAPATSLFPEWKQWRCLCSASNSCKAIRNDIQVIFLKSPTTMVTPMIWFRHILTTFWKAVYKDIVKLTQRTFLVCSFNFKLSSLEAGESRESC